MKVIVMVCLAVVITTAASAQKYNRGRYPQPRVRTSISVGVGSPYYSPYRSSPSHSPYYSPYRTSPYHSPFYRSYPYRSTRSLPYYSTPVYSRPSELEMELSDLRADYNDRIWYVRHDKSLSKSERKAEIRRLKSERDRAIRNAEYSYQRSRY